MPPAGLAVRARPQIEMLQEVMRAVDERLVDIFADLPRSYQPLMANALLNLSVNQILTEEGAIATASLLLRLTSLIMAGEQPGDTGGFPLNGADA